MRPTIERVPDLRQQVFERLRERINKGAIGGEERLTEMTVAKQFGVSRTPAREALALLHQAGLLMLDERGYRLPNFSRKDIDEVFEVRHLIEPYAVRCICADASDAELRSLMRFASSEFARNADCDAYVEANRRIRLRLFALLRNEKLRHLVSLFEDRLAFIRVRTLRDPAIRSISVEGNQRLLAAVGDRDGAKAAETMTYLLNEAHRAIVGLL